MRGAMMPERFMGMGRSCGRAGVRAVDKGGCGRRFWVGSTQVKEWMVVWA